MGVEGEAEEAVVVVQLAGFFARTHHGEEEVVCTEESVESGWRTDRADTDGSYLADHIV